LRIRKMLWHMMDGKWRHPRQGWRCTKSLSSFSNEKLEVQECARTSIFEPHPCQRLGHDGNRRLPVGCTFGEWRQAIVGKV